MSQVKKSNRYEFAFILPADLGTKDEEAEITKIKQLLKEYEVEVESEDKWGIRNFAYNINKTDKGNYIIFYVRANTPSKLQALYKELNLKKKIIRYLFIKIPEFWKPTKAEEIYEKTEALMKTLDEKDKEEASILQAELEKITTKKKPLISTSI